jgi:hypothetical protein
MMEGYQRQVAISQCTPERFGDGDLRFYLKRFCEHAKANGWNEGLMCVRLPLFLDGRAYAIFQQVNGAEQEVSWDELSSAFIALFHPPEERMVWMKEFHKRVARPNESLEALAADLKRMLRYALPDATLGQLDVLLKFQFLRALPQDLSRGLEERAHAWTIDQLVSKARLRSLGPHASPSNAPICGVVVPLRQTQAQQETRTMDDLQQQVEDLRAEVQRIHHNPKLTASSFTGRNESSRCYTCGRTGHFARNCKAGNGKGPRRY